MSFIDWKDVFDDVFESYPNKWALIYVHRNSAVRSKTLKNQRTMERTGYARFHCTKCSNNWTSAKGMVMFYYPNLNQRLGQVTLRFLGQQCKKCSGKNFADPEFDTEIIQIIIQKLYERIGWNCYGKQRPPKKQEPNHHKNKIQGPHEKDLCEACQLGFCEKL